jgi:hypothetical protein
MLFRSLLPATESTLAWCAVFSQDTPQSVVEQKPHHVFKHIYLSSSSEIKPNCVISLVVSILNHLQQIAKPLKVALSASWNEICAGKLDANSFIPNSTSKPCGCR